MRSRTRYVAMGLFGLVAPWGFGGSGVAQVMPAEPVAASADGPPEQIAGTSLEPVEIAGTSPEPEIAGPSPAPGEITGASPEPAEGVGTRSGEPIEEVVVRGRRSVMQLRNEAGRKTREFYNLLNAFLDEPDYRIRCFKGRPPQGGAVQQVCRAAYQERAARRLVENVALASASSEDVPVYELMMLYDPSLEMMERTAEFTSAILTAVNTHPELNRAARELLELKREIVAAEQAPRRERRERRERRRND